MGDTLQTYMQEEPMLAPLRRVMKIVKVPVTYSTGNTYEFVRELLECGHTQGIKQDIYGPTNAYRRRCRQCLAALASFGQGGGG